MNIYFPILDRLQIKLQRWCSSYELIFKKFSFLFNICDESIDAGTEDLMRETGNFQTFYKEDIEETFFFECIHFRNYKKNTQMKEGFNGINLFGFIRDHHLEDLFPNVNIASQLYSTMAVTNCTAERSFLILRGLKITFDRLSLKEN